MNITLALITSTSGLCITLLILSVIAVIKYLKLCSKVIDRVNEVDWLTVYVKEVEAESAAAIRLDKYNNFNMSLKYLQLPAEWMATAFNKYKIFISAQSVGKDAYHCHLCYITDRGHEFVFINPYNTIRSISFKGLSDEVAYTFVGKIVFAKGGFNPEAQYKSNFYLYVTNCNLNGECVGGKPKIIGKYEYDKDMRKGEYCII